MNQKQSILAIDDDPKIISILHDILKNSYEIFAATNGEDGLSILRQEPIDLVLLDVVMSEMDGFSVCKELKSDVKLKDIPVIFITSKDDPNEEAQGLGYGANDYLNKPVSAPILIARVRTHLAMAKANRMLKEQNKTLTHLYEEKKEMLEIAENLRTKLEQAQSEKIQNARLVSLVEMAAGMAHEINNPLAIINGKASLLLQHLKEKNFDPEDGIKKLTSIIQTAGRISNIISGLRTFSRNADNDPMLPIKLKTLFEKVFNLCSEKFKANGIELIVGPIPDLILRCRGVQIEQVLRQLLNNAYDAVLSLPEKWTRIEATIHEKQLHIRITDSGNGIPPSISEKLMEPFFTTKDVGKGTGLGLSISKGIIEDHEGKLYYDDLGTHTSFIVELPLTQNKQ